MIGLFPGIGLDSAIIPLKRNNLFLVQSVDFFYPLCDDSYLMGLIAFANVVSDIYSCGVVNIDELKITLSLPIDLNEDEQEIVVSGILKGFKESAAVAKCLVSIESIGLNPWCVIGGIASSVCTRDEIIMPTKAQPGDVLILTKPLGVQLATNAPIWMEEDSDNWKKISEHLTKDDINEAYAKAVKSMTTLNKVAAELMHKFKAHAATDITGFGLLGHAENLLQHQELELDFVIKILPVIRHVKKIAEVLNRHQKLYSGRMVETSGGLLISLPKEHAQDFCKEFEAMSGCECWIIGDVVNGSRKAIVENANIVEV